MTLEQKIDLLLSRGITKTRFASITLPVYGNAAQAQPAVALGQGKCKAVILHGNTYKVLSSSANNAGTDSVLLYYGDADQQTFELLVYDNNIFPSAFHNLRSSELIFCEDLSEIWVRAFGVSGDGGPVEIQILIYE